MPLVNTGLVGRYYFDEAASGTAPTQVDDASANAYHLTTVNYGVSSAYTEVSGNRGFDSTATTGTQRARRAINDTSDALRDVLAGAQKATIEIVFAPDAFSASGGRIFGINNRSGANGELMLKATALNAPVLAFNDVDYVIGGLAFTGGARVVLHIVLDTTLATFGERIRYSLNGAAFVNAGSGEPVLPQNETLALGASLDLIALNRESSGSFDRSMDGVLYYAAIYAHAFTAADVTTNYDILTADDDEPVVGAPGGNMKVALGQAAMPAAIGTQDFTDSVFSGGDAKNLLLFGTRATTNDTDTAVGALALGSTDKTRLGTFSTANQDNVTTTAARNFGSNGLCISLASYVSVESLAEADLSGVTHPASGVQVNWTDVNAQELFNALLLGGDNIEVSTVTALFTSAGDPETISIAHQLSAAPDLLIGFYGANLNNGSSGAARASIGFYDRRANQYAGMASVRLHNTAGSNSAGSISSSWLVAQQDNAATPGKTLTVGNFTATTFDLTKVGAADSNMVTLICLRGKNAPMNVKVGIADTPASVGEFTPVSGMAGIPSVVLWLPTRLVAVGGSTTDEGGCAGLGVSVNNRGITQQGCCVDSDADAASPTDTHCRTSNTRSVIVLSQSGAIALAASVAKWAADGIVLDASTTVGVALKLPYCAFGMPTPLPVRVRTNPLLRM